MEKSFMDPIHGFIVVDEDWLLRLVDTPEFQRLRRVRQLGVSAGTYHGAEHSRFGHSLGAFSVMKRVLAHLGGAGVSIDELDRLAALGAALLHDIGHGPFSHALENLLTPGIGHERWSEAVVMGTTRINRILAEVDPTLPRAVAQLIIGRHPTPWMSQLVASQLDVDRFDYLLRDSLYTGTGYGRFDLERIIQTLTVVDDRLALEIKGLHAAEEYVLARHFMYWRVYLHKTIRAQELMLRSVVRRARSLWEAGEDVDLPWSLRDLWSLEGSSRPKFQGADSGSVDEERLTMYLDLDDADIIVALKMWRKSPDPTLADLSRRLLDRDLLKPLYRHPKDGVAGRILAVARDFVAAEGFDPDYYCLVDGAPGSPYDAVYGPAAEEEAINGKAIQDPISAEPGLQDPILIVGSDGELIELPELSPLIRALKGRPEEAVNLYLPAPARDRVRAIAD